MVFAPDGERDPEVVVGADEELHTSGVEDVDEVHVDDEGAVDAHELVSRQGVSEGVQALFDLLEGDGERVVGLAIVHVNVAVLAVGFDVSDVLEVDTNEAGAIVEHYDLVCNHNGWGVMNRDRPVLTHG